MRLMGLDYGSKTVGVALSDPLRITAEPFETIVRKEENKQRRTLARIKEIAEEMEVSAVILGNPVHMDGSPSERSEATLLFKEALKRRLSLPVISWDERLSTVEAAEILTEMGVPKNAQKTYIDKIAAGVILKDFLSIGKERMEKIISDAENA